MQQQIVSACKITQHSPQLIHYGTVCLNYQPFSRACYGVQYTIEHLITIVSCGTRNVGITDHDKCITVST